MLDDPELIALAQASAAGGGGDDSRRRKALLRWASTRPAFRSLLASVSDCKDLCDLGCGPAGISKRRGSERPYRPRPFPSPSSKRWTAKPAAITNLQAHDVKIRLLGEVAIIHARTTYLGLDGREVAGRYTDVWARRDGRWLAVSAHVTRG